MGKRGVVALIAAVALLLTLPALAPAKTVVLKMGGVLPAEDAASKSMKAMADLVAQKTNGGLKVEVYPASQLGDAISQIEGVTMGSQDMFVDAGSWLAQYVPDKQVESLFFLFNDENHYKAYLDSDVYKGMEEMFLKKTGVRILANNWIRVPRDYASNKPLKTVEDLKGLKIRAPQIKGYIMSHQALGSSPTQIPWGEAYLALSQKVVDACEGPIDILYASKIQEVCPYFLMTDHIRDNIVVLINDKKFQSLTKDEQKALVEAARAAGEAYSKSLHDRLNGVLEKLKAAGATITPVADRKPFAQKVFSAAEKLEAEGAWTKGLFEKVRNLK